MLFDEKLVVQVVGKKWEEEKVIEMMKVVDQALGPRGFGPGSWSKQRDTTKTPEATHTIDEQVG